MTADCDLKSAGTRSVSEIRRKAWATRRKKYGPKGHARQYRQTSLCPNCNRLQAENDALRQRLAETVKRETGDQA